MKYQYLPNSPSSEADIIIQRVCFGESVSAKGGTESAPDAILEASNTLEYYDEDLEWSPMKFLNISVEKSIFTYEEISSKTEALHVGERQLLISLGGDHSITPQITQGLLEEPTTILFLDAHADLRESYMGNVWSHATPAHHLLEQGHKLIMVGVRSLFEKEADRVKHDANISFYGDRALQQESTKEKLFEELRALEGRLYLSIDMDVFNPAFVPSVGTPQPGGIDYYFATEILHVLFFDSEATVVGVDMVELIPEANSVSQTFGAKLLQKIISYWGKSQAFDKSLEKGAQTRVEYE